MSKLMTYNSERIYWALEQVEQEAGDIDDLHLDDNLFYLKSEADKVIEDIVKGASSMFREFSCCRGLDTKSPLGEIADVAYKHWMRDSITENENKLLKDEKDRLLYDNRQLLDRTFQLEKHIISQDRQIRRQKYKRCLDKAAYWLAVSYKCIDYKHQRNAEKNHYRWLDLAIKFKEVE